MSIRMPAQLGSLFYAASILAIGLLGFIEADFVAIWAPVSKSVPAHDALVYLCAFASVACGAGLLVRRTAPVAARLWLGFLVAWFIVFKARVPLAAPTVAVSWESTGEIAVVTAAAWARHIRLAADWDRRYIGFAVGSSALRFARAMFGLALIAFGAAHFAYPRETAALVPAWLPSPSSWVYLTGCTYVAAGIAALANVLGRLAAALATVQMGLFTVLIWLPFVAAGADASQWSETILSLALTAAAWVVAESYQASGHVAPPLRAREPISNNATSVKPPAADR